MNTILICKCCSQIFELCHAFKGPIAYLYALPLSLNVATFFLLKSLVANNQERFQTNLQVHSFKTQGIKIILTDQLPDFHVLRKVQNILSKKNFRNLPSSYRILHPSATYSSLTCLAIKIPVLKKR
jgi:hypothetical protein